MSQPLNRYLRRAQQLHTNQISEMEALQAAIFRSTIYGKSVDLHATVSEISSDGVRLFYSELQGYMVRDADSPSNDVTVGIVLSGTATIAGDLGRVDLNAGQGMLLLPGDATIQASQDLRAFTVRVSTSEVMLMRMRALPYHLLQAFPRGLSASDALDLQNLVTFLSDEYDRSDVESPEKSSQISVLLGAVKARVALLFSALFPPMPQATEEKIRICLTASKLAEVPRMAKLTAAEMAYHAYCSTRQLYRAFNDVMGTNPMEYVQRVKIQRARTGFLWTARRGDAVTFDHSEFGFSSKAAFTARYRQEYGEEPGDTLERRRRDLALLLQNQDVV